MARCEKCDDVGLVPTERGSRPCDCQREIEIAARLRRARIPEAFSAATLSSFKPAAHTRAAAMTARRYAEEFLPGATKTGLLLTGSVGTGKTHLAVGILRAAIEAKGIEGRFVDMRELMERLRRSYSSSAVTETQAQVLDPLLFADLVAIDELGAARPTDWAFEIVELLIGELYNRCRPVIVTTNLANAAPGAGTANEYARAARAETLGDRIGARMFSRLQQMCAEIAISGPDWRSGGKNGKQ